MTSPQIPQVPPYLQSPIVFMDFRLGLVLAATWPDGKLWLYRLHGDHWCSLREAGPKDVMIVDGLRDKVPATAVMVTSPRVDSIPCLDGAPTGIYLGYGMHTWAWVMAPEVE